MDQSFTPLLRDLIMTGVIFGTMAFAWFGWGQEGPPERWRPFLGAGSALSAMVAIGSGFLAARHWGAPTVFDGPRAGITYGVAVAIEVVICLIGALILRQRGLGKYAPVWICAVVAVHFIPLIFLFHNPMLIFPTIAMAAVASLAWRVGRRGTILPSAITGLGSGIVLFVTAGISLLQALPLL